MIPYQVQREIKFRRRLFSSSMKCQIKQTSRRSRAKKAKKCTKKCDALAKLSFYLLNLLFCCCFLTFSLVERVRRASA